MYKKLFFLGILVSLMACTGASTDEPTPVDPNVEITAISFETNRINGAKVGDEITLKVTLTPADADPAKLVWSTDNERVARYQDGVIKVKGPGTARIMATAGNASDKVDIYVDQITNRSYTLFFEDEFNGNSVDETKWNFETGPAQNNEKQYYKKENARVENGQLIITGKKEVTTVPNRGTWNYTSARLNTKDKVFLTYGKIEARISLPAGKGTWPAFWMMPNKSVYGNWPRSGEIDIMEHVGSDPTMISHALHTQNANMNGYPAINWSARKYFTTDPVENAFHTYAIEWIERYYNGGDAIIFYIDGVQTAIKYQNNWQTSTSADWPFNIDFFAILNLALGGSFGGTIDDGIFPVEMKVDWVRMYKPVN